MKRLVFVKLNAALLQQPDACASSLLSTARLLQGSTIGKRAVNCRSADDRIDSLSEFCLYLRNKNTKTFRTCRECPRSLWAGGNDLMEPASHLWRNGLLVRGETKGLHNSPQDERDAGTPWSWEMYQVKKHLGNAGKRTLMISRHQGPYGAKRLY